MQRYVENEEKLEVLENLKSPSLVDYLYSHDNGGWIEQEHLTKELSFYSFCDIGFEKPLDEWGKKIKRKSNTNLRITPAVISFSFLVGGWL